MLSLMTFFLPFHLLIPIHGMVQLVSNSTRTWYLRKWLKSKMILPFLIGSPLGALVSTLLIKKLDSPNIPLLLIATMILYTIFKPKRLPELKLPNWAYGIIGFISGMLGILVGATGPFLAPFFIRDDLSKEEVVANKSGMQIITHATKVPAFFYLDFKYFDHMPVIAAMTLAAVLGTKYGVILLGKINERVFRIFFKSLLMVAALRILYKVFV